MKKNPNIHLITGIAIDHTQIITLIMNSKAKVINLRIFIFTETPPLEISIVLIEAI